MHFSACSLNSVTKRDGSFDQIANASACTSQMRALRAGGKMVLSVGKKIRSTSSPSRHMGGLCTVPKRLNAGSGNELNALGLNTEPQGPALTRSMLFDEHGRQGFGRNEKISSFAVSRLSAQQYPKRQWLRASRDVRLHWRPDHRHQSLIVVKKGTKFCVGPNDVLAAPGDATERWVMVRGDAVGSPATPKTAVGSTHADGDVSSLCSTASSCLWIPQRTQNGLQNLKASIAPHILRVRPKRFRVRARMVPPLTTDAIATPARERLWALRSQIIAEPLDSAGNHTHGTDRPAETSAGNVSTAEGSDAASSEQDISRFLRSLYPQTHKQRERMMLNKLNRNMVRRLPPLSGYGGYWLHSAKHGRGGFVEQYFRLVKLGMSGVQVAALVFGPSKVRVDAAVKSRRFSTLNILSRVSGVGKLPGNRGRSMQIFASFNGAKPTSHVIGFSSAELCSLWVVTVESYKNGCACVGASF